MSQLLHSFFHVLLSFSSDWYGELLYVDGVAKWMDKEEALFGAVLALICIFAGLLDGKFNPPDFIPFAIDCILSHTFVGALVERRWPGDNFYATLRNPDVGVVPSLLCIFMTAPFVLLKHVAADNLHLARRLLIFGAGYICQSLVKAGTHIGDSFSQLLELAVRSLKLIIRMPGAFALLIVRIVFATQIQARMAILSLGGRIWLVGKQGISVFWATTTFAYCRSAELYGFTIELGMRLVSGFLKAVVQTQLAFLYILSTARGLVIHVLHSLTDAVFHAAGTVFRVVKLMLAFLLVGLRVSAASVKLGTARVAITVLKLGKGVSLLVKLVGSTIWSLWSAVSFVCCQLFAFSKMIPKAFFGMSIAAAKFGLQTALSCLKTARHALIQVSKTVLKFGGKASLIGRHVAAGFWALCGRVLAVVMVIPSSCFRVCITTLQASKQLLPSSKVNERRVKLDEMLTSPGQKLGATTTTTFWSIIEPIDALVSLVFRLSTSGFSKAGSLCKLMSSIVMQMANWCAKRLWNSAIFTRALSRRLFSDIGRCSSQLLVLTSNAIRSFTPSNIVLHQKGIMMWRAFCAGLVYTSCILALYLVIVGTMRHHLEESRLDEGCRRVSDSPKANSSNISKSLWATSGKARQNYSIAAHCAAATAQNFIACGGLRRSAIEHRSYHAIHATELESKIHILEKHTVEQEKKLDLYAEEQNDLLNEVAESKRHHVQLPPSYAAALASGLEEARLHLERGSTDLEDAAKAWTVEQRQHNFKYRKDIATAGRSVYAKLYEGDLDLIDFLDLKPVDISADDRVTNHRSIALPLPSSSLLVDVDLEEMCSLRAELDSELRVLEGARNSEESHSHFLDDDSEMDFEVGLDLASSPLPRSRVRKYGPVAQRRMAKQRQLQERNLRVREEFVKMGTMLLALDANGLEKI
ncbi:hypothetical protein DFH11DRAFT_1616489 [Phellopilus nigrolimitatus]|nr:hypothetical protein DFH11DRAFT_1616489 [Phellopilus nigrolimitatus]